MENKGYLLLADGQLYEGVLRGAVKSADGEAVFLTNVVGYMDTLTDPAYAGQIVVQTFPQIGNYGVVPLADVSAKPALRGYVCRELCDTPSNFRCQGTVNAYLEENGIPCLTGVDTRAITRHLRENGVMNAAILTEKPADVEEAAAVLRTLSFKANLNAASVRDVIPAAKEGKYSVVLWDLGAMGDTLTQLESRGCAVTIVPAGIKAEQIMSLAPDGVVISNGPGDPEDAERIANEIRELCNRRMPMFAIGLGHQLLAISQGAATVKLPCGHRGANQPIEDVKTGSCYITSQNHGYAVDRDALPTDASLRFVNRNDNSCEGIDYMNMPAFSVQFQPALTGGFSQTGGQVGNAAAKVGTHFLFDRFIALMGGNKECR